MGIIFNMARWILTVLLIIFCTASSAFAYKTPRWQFFPVAIAVQDHPKAGLVKQAFSEWETKTGMVKFDYVNPAKRRPCIDVSFAEKRTDSTVVGYARTNRIFQAGFYSKVSIVIYLSHPKTGEKLSDEQLYKIALHEMGHTLGLSHSKSTGDIMYPNLSMIATSHLSSGDLRQFDYIYKPIKK